MHMACISTRIDCKETLSYCATNVCVCVYGHRRWCSPLFFLRLQWILWIPLIVHKQLPARNMLCGRILVSLLRKLANCYPQYIFIHLKNKTQIKEFYVALGYKWERGLHYMHRHQKKKHALHCCLKLAIFEHREKVEWILLGFCLFHY